MEPSALVWAIVCVVVLPVVAAGVGYLAYWLFSLPLRRRERARVLLDLIELGVRRGETPERTLLSAAASGDPALGLKFHLLAAHLDAGLRLDQALERVRHFLPEEIVAMLRAGRELGDVARCLPACRNRLEDGVATVWKGHHYLALLALVISPAWILVFVGLLVFVAPKFNMIFLEMTEGPLPPFFQMLADWRGPLIWTQVVLLVFFYVLDLVYVLGPRAKDWVGAVLPGFPDQLLFKLPWWRKRMQRDFSAVLAGLLDAGMPEPRAVTLAAEATANAVFEGRAAAVVADLGRGVRLPEAVRHLDDAGEFRWRIENARPGSGRFLAALEGWHEALAARAFQLEQTAAQLLTTGIVLVNGLFVGALAAAVFGMLVDILNQAYLW